MRPYEDSTELLQRPKSQARQFHARDVLVGLNGTCRVRGWDGLDSRTNGTPGGTTGLATQSRSSSRVQIHVIRKIGLSAKDIPCNRAYPRKRNRETDFQKGLTVANGCV
jgi:hypothetical protein